VSARVLPEPTDAVRAAYVALAAGAVIVLSAAVVSALAAARVRAGLGFAFGGVPRTFEETRVILGANVRLMTSVVGVAAIVQSARLGSPDRGLGRGGRAARMACDLALIAVFVFNAAFVGATIGAYGARMVVAMLPHGPVELAAFALAIALYLRVRSEPLRTRVALTLAGWSLGLLALAALLETFLHF
jgi:hypothetical protein